MTKAEVEKNIKFIQSEMDKPITEGSIEEAMQKLSDIQIMFGLSAETVKWAKKYALQQQGSLLPELFKKGLTASMFKYQLEAEMAEEISLLTYAERINAGLVHVVDSLRTCISLYKTE